MKVSEIIACVLGAAGLLFVAVSFFTGFDEACEFLYQYWWLIIVAIAIIICCLIYAETQKNKGYALTNKGKFILFFVASLAFSAIAVSTVKDVAVRYYCGTPIIAGFGALIGLQMYPLWSILHLLLVEPIRDFFGMESQQATIGNQKDKTAAGFKRSAIITAVVCIVVYLILPYTDITLKTIH